MKRVVILGGGYAGATAAIHLSRRSAEPLELTLVEPRAVPGQGLAHSTPHPDHRLNGPPGNHSVHPDEPDHFARWLAESGTLAADPAATEPTGLCFARRLDFGRYMAAELERHAGANPSGSPIAHVREAAVSIERRAAGPLVRLGSGRALAADRCVLALGWDAVGVPAPLRPLTGHPGWFGDPWDSQRLGGLPRGASILLVGAGLTASDTFATLAAQGHQGPVLAFSRRGLRSASQNPYRVRGRTVWDVLLDPAPAFVARHGAPATVREALQALRRDIAAIDPATASWHGAFDALRDASLHFWPALPAAEKRRFARHLKTWYDAHRYRNPPQTERIVAEGERRGQLRFAAGRLQSAHAGAAGIEVAYDERGSGARRTVRVDAVINCTGPQPRPGASANPLWRSLIASGAVRDHPCGIGIEVDRGSRVIDAAGRADPTLFALGPPAAGSLGETTGVPHVAHQMIGLAAALLGPAATRPPGAAHGWACGRCSVQSIRRPPSRNGCGPSKASTHAV